MRWIGRRHGGLINEPRRCTYNATQRPAPLPDAGRGRCDGIWDGPRNQRGQRPWGGIPRGTSFGTLLTAGKNPFPFILTWQANWVHEDPFFDWKTMKLTNFSSECELASRKFADCGRDR